MKKILICFILILIIFLNITSSCVKAQDSFEMILAKFYKDHPNIYKESIMKINNIDPNLAKSNNSFPGLRGPNQLMIYTPKFGSRTGTNEFGTEATVINGVVTQINGADSIIPANGFVISGHGRAKKWINDNIQVGTNILIDYKNQNVLSFLTPESFAFQAKFKIQETQNIMDFYFKNSSSYNCCDSKIYMKRAKNYLQKGAKNYKNLHKYSRYAIECANKALENAIPFKLDEFKGIWIRPVESSRSEISQTLDTIEKSGIDNVFLETYFHGKTIYPSNVLANYGVINQHPQFTGFDPLAVWIDEAHKRNIKIHIWFETFYVGNSNPFENPYSILYKYPSWANLTKALYSSDIPVPSLSEHNGYFLDPANPEVQKFLLAIINELVCKYHPDGINLDYIRYPQSCDPKYGNYVNSNWGYTKFAREDFKNTFDVDPVDIKYSDPLWTQWALYRQNKVSDFVAKVSAITKPNKVFLSAVIFPDKKKSLAVKMQDWATWSFRGYVDAYTPLLLTCSKDTASLFINEIKANSRPCMKIFPGIFVPFMDGNSDDLLRIIHETRVLKSDGVVLFDFAHLKPKYVSSLNVSAFNKSNVFQNKQMNANINKSQKTINKNCKEKN